MLARAAFSCRTRTEGEKLKFTHLICLNVFFIFYFFKSLVSYSLSLSLFGENGISAVHSRTSCRKQPSVFLHRYYDYIFGFAKKQGPNKSRRPSDGPSELTELQVWITSPDSECDGYPSVASDESCEYLVLFIDKNICHIHSGASGKWWALQQFLHFSFNLRLITLHQQHFYILNPYRNIFNTLAAY